MQYHVIRSSKAAGINTFMKMIKESIAAGWQLQGGIAVDSHHYYQAVFKGTRI